MSSPQPKPAGKPRSIRPLILLALVCLAPLVFALLAYYVPSLGLRPAENTNYGAILEPQRPMPDSSKLQLTTLEGEPFDLKSLQGKWLLISADQSACPESCARKLFILRNSHASQGKNVDRLKRIWFITDDGKVPENVLDAYQGNVFLRADPAQLAEFLAPGAGAAEHDAALRAPMWIIDPLGNLMLEFPADADPFKVRKDISKLLFSSRVG